MIKKRTVALRCELRPSPELPSGHAELLFWGRRGGHHSIPCRDGEKMLSVEAGSCCLLCAGGEARGSSPCRLGVSSGPHGMQACPGCAVGRGVELPGPARACPLPAWLRFWNPETVPHYVAGVHRRRASCWKVSCLGGQARCPRGAGQEQGGAPGREGRSLGTHSSPSRRDPEVAGLSLSHWFQGSYYNQPWAGREAQEEAGA